jgi:phosphoglycerate-specific signal transduction histidine kinase
LDLLANTLTEHEKNLDQLVERLEKICEHLSSFRRKEESIEVTEAGRAVPEGALETLVYMKLKTKRSAEELKKILDSLKE